MFCLRNRLIGLFYRAGALATMIAALIFFWRTFEFRYAPWAFYVVQSGILYIVLLILNLVFNAIDMRRGIHGLPSSTYLPVATAIWCYAMSAGLLGLGYHLPFGLTHVTAASLATPWSIAYYCLLFALPFAEWLMFAEKGGIRPFSAWTWLAYPILYILFILFRAIIWVDDPVYGVEMYPLPWLNPNMDENPLFFLWLFLALIALYAFFMFIIFLGKLLGGRFKKKDILDVN